MAHFTRFSTFEDAFHFYVRANSLPHTSSAGAEVDRCVRVSILLSWVGFEEALKESAAMLRKQGALTTTAPRKLYQALTELQSIYGKPHLPKSDFMRMRAIRNDIAHANNASTVPIHKPDDALETFKFCFLTAQTIWPWQLLHPSRQRVPSKWEKGLP